MIKYCSAVIHGFWVAYPVNFGLYNIMTVCGVSDFHSLAWIAMKLSAHHHEVLNDGTNISFVWLSYSPQSYVLVNIHVY